MKEKHGKVYLVGAGPGDPKLLTLKAVEAIAACDVLVYDYLINPKMLNYARQDVTLIYAGKRAGLPSISQEEINQILIDQALAGNQVVRLKGGDPFIFGRGGEEAEALVNHHIAWEIIPGISSGIAAAAFAGIPLTHRNYSSSVAFITGQEGGKNGKRTARRELARAFDTLVVFMSGSTIASIAEELLEGGRKPDTPVAVIRWATYEHQEVYYRKLADLAASQEKFAPPAIAIIGEVVRLRENLKWFTSEHEYALQTLLTNEMAYAEVA